MIEISLNENKLDFNYLDLKIDICSLFFSNNMLFKKLFATLIISQELRKFPKYLISKKIFNYKNYF